MEKFGRETREYMFNELKQRFEKKQNVFVTSFSNIKVADLQDLRLSLKENASEYFVVKNTITKRVLKTVQQDDVTPMVDSMCGMVFVGGDPVAVSKILIDFQKEHEGLDIKGGLFDGALISFEKVKALSTLPSRPVLLSMVAAGMCAPISGIVNSMAGIMRKFLYAVKAIKDKKEEKHE